MSNVIIPEQHKAVHLGDITKSQLGKMVNELNQMLLKARSQQRHLVNFLVAITTEPDAMSRNADGAPLLDVEAVNRVKDGTQFHVREHDGAYVFSVTEPGDLPAVEAPSKIIVPKWGGDGAH